jgi:NitT/TauT family transport system permease protein
MFLAVIVLLWDEIVLRAAIPPYIFPTPLLVWRYIVHNIGSLLEDTKLTLAESIAGTVLGSLTGLTLACIFVYNRVARDGLYPFVVTFKAIPLVAIAPLMIIWFGNGVFGKIVMCSTISFFPMVVNCMQGLRDVDPLLLELMDSLSATRLQVFRMLRLWSFLPSFFSGLQVTATLSVVGALVAELSGSDKGIGHAILLASYHNDTPMLFAAISVISVATLLLVLCIQLTEHYALFWLPKEKKN